MPLLEYKLAYEKMKLGDKGVIYHHGSIGERDDYFGISKHDGDFFQRALSDGIIKGMFCGHDHYNNISLTYKGIRLTYGMSIDFLGYKDIMNRHAHRGGTVIDILQDGQFNVSMLPLTKVVSQVVRGIKN